MSPCDSSVFTEGYLSTTLDKRKQFDSFVFNIRLLPTTTDHKEYQTYSEQKSGQTGMLKILYVLVNFSCKYVCD